MKVSFNHTLCLFLSILPAFFSAAIVIQGDTTGSTSFTFPVGPYVRSSFGSFFYVGSLNAGVAGEFALARVFENQTSFESFAPSTATINGFPNQSNPLFDAAISQLGTFETSVGLNRTIPFPMIVPQASPANLFLVRDKKGANLSMLALSNMKDVNGLTTQGIIGLQPFYSEAIFAATEPNSGVFGDQGSGVAVVRLGNLQIDNVSQAVLVQVNADPNSLLPSTDPAASPLDVTSDSLKINSDLASIASVIDMHFSARLQRLYVALAVQGGAGALDGARAIAVGQLANNKLSFFKIAPDNVFTDSNEIVGGVGPSAQISIHKVRTMYSSTKLDYLIVVGGNGDQASTQRSVYALPLVNTIPTGTVDNAIQGTLANVNDAPISIFSNSNNNQCSNAPQLFQGRVFSTAATAPGEIYLSSSVEAVVGGGQLPYGDITDINVYNDAVFVSVADTINNELPGIFYSQSLFDDNGVIVAWTPWQRVAGTTDPVFGFSYQPPLGNFLWLTGTTNITINTAKQTVWGLGSEQGLADLVVVLSDLFPSSTGGIQGFFDLPSNTPGLFDISMFIATGNGQVVLVESGEVTAGVLSPNGGDFQTDLQQFTDGQITVNFPVGVVKVVSISGGVLTDIGPIIASTIGVNSTTNQGYLFVGGAYGLAVLDQPNGAGWSTITGLGKQFDGLVSGMQFKTIGDYSFVRKLIFDQGFLYVLSDTQLDRIDIAASDFSTGLLSVVTVATLADAARAGDGTLLDIVVSGKFALLASSTGLVRVGNGANIQTAFNSAEVDWTNVLIPEGVPVVQYLQAISSSANPNSWAQGVGNLYINDAYRGFDCSQLNRYTVADTSSSSVTDNTVIPLPDMYIKNILTSYKIFSNFRNIILVDGADLFTTRDRVLCAPPIVFNWNTPLPLSIDNYSAITAVVRSSASGAWLVAGDFDLRVNE